MIRFLKNFFLFGLTFFLLDKLLIIPFEINPKQVIDQRIHQALKGEHDADILILGSSRGARNFLAGEIENSLNRKTLNFSYPGANIEFHEFLLRIYLNNQKAPKLLVLVMDDHSTFHNDNSLEFRYDQLYPLMKFPEIVNEMVKRKEKSPLSYLFYIGRVSKTTFDFGKQTFTQYDSLSSNGSMPISFQSESFNKQFDSLNLEYDQEKELESRINAFLNIQHFCETHNIELLVAFPPNFKNLNPQFYKRVDELQSYGNQFIYDSTSVLYKDPKYFHDVNHLLDDGAEFFTKDFVQYLKENYRF
jgi:hypothetical protein